MSTKSETLRMWFITQTEQAVLVCDEPVQVPRRQIWIPRVLIHRLTRTPPAQPGPRDAVEFTLPEWKINELQLWDFVTA